MTEFFISQEELEKWMHQNRAQYTGVFINGRLWDNFVVATKRGFAAIYEHPLSEWRSAYWVEFEPGAAQRVWHRWYQFEERSRERVCWPSCGGSCTNV